MGALDDGAERISIARRELNPHATSAGLDELLIDVLRLQPTGRPCLNGTDLPARRPVLA
jgi:hypothetical protein